MRALSLYITLILLVPLNLYARPEKISDKSDPTGNFNIYYFFSFHCAACAQWSPTFEEQLKVFHANKKVKVHFAPFAMDRSERLMSRAYVLTKGLGVNNISSDYFDLYNNSYFITEKKVKQVVDGHVKHMHLPQSPWSDSNITYVDGKIRKYMMVAREYQLREVPAFIVTGPDGVYKFISSEDLEPESLIGVIEEFVASHQS